MRKYRVTVTCKSSRPSGYLRHLDVEAYSPAAAEYKALQLLNPSGRKALFAIATEVRS